MPALKLFNRRWLLAEDDVPAPAAFLAIFHTIWVALLIAWIAEIKGPANCQGINKYYVAIGGLLASFTIALALEIAAIVVGLRGSIFETRKRASLPSIIYSTILCILAQISFNSYCTFLYYTDPPKCTTHAGDAWDPRDVLQAAVWSTWALIAGIVCLGVTAYNLFPNYKDTQQWERHCTYLGLTCCPWSKSSFDRRTAGKRLGSLFSLMFSHVDFTPSDVLASFILTLNAHRVQSRVLAKVTAKRSHRSQGSFSALCSAEASRRGSQSIPMQKATLAVGGAEPFSSSPSLVSDSTTSESHEGLLSTEMQSHRATSLLAADLDIEKITRGPSLPHNSMRLLNGSIDGTDVHGALHDTDDADDDADGDDDVVGIVDYDSLAEATYFMKYAFAVYGWMLFVWNEHAVGCCKLCCGRGCGMLNGLISGRYGVPGAHSSPYFNTEAILQAAHLKEQDLITVRREGEIPNVLPYFIAVDHEKKAVVLSIRGSLSFDDVLRDLMYEPAELDEWLKAENPWDVSLPPVTPAMRSSSRYAAHSGILEAARGTVEDIRSKGHLQRLLPVKGHAASPLLDATPTTSTRDYRLVVCGHSLGAGCSFLISLYLKNYFPNLHCFAFSPPGGLASGDLCAASSEWCTSVVCGKEMIPRFTLATFERMRDEFVHAAAYCKMPKLKLLANSLIGKVYTKKDLFYSPEALPDEPRQWLEEYHASLDATTAERAYLESAAKFGPPGRVMHLRATGRKHAVSRSWMQLLTGKKTRGGYGVEREYRCVWVDGQKMVNKGIELSGRMMLDHFPDYCLALMRKLTESAAHHGTRATMSDTVEVLSEGGGMPEIRVV